MFWSRPPSDPKNPKNPANHTPPPPPVSEQDNGSLDKLKQGYAATSTESNIRYAAYAARVKTILLSAHRYVAYTSDIGESFRPVAHPYIVRGAYGISWLYILGDVGYEGYKAYLQNERIRNPATSLSHPDATSVEGSNVAKKEDQRRQPGVVPPIEDYRTVMVQRTIFQSVASMGLPAFTIHSVVKYSGRAMKGVKSAGLRTWGPIGLGLSVVPFLPSIFDKPVENAVDWAFHSVFKAYGGSQFVADSPATGREELLARRPKEKGE